LGLVQLQKMAQMTMIARVYIRCGSRQTQNNVKLLLESINLISQ